jgi:hypothetical protein
MFAQNWGNTIFLSLETMWGVFVGFIPEFVSAVVILLIGIIIAVGLAKLGRRLVNALKIDMILEKMGFKGPMDRAGMKLDVGYFVGELIKWFLIIVFVLAASDILGLTMVSEFLNNVLLYIPKVIVAVFILLAAIIVASFLERLVKAAVLASNFSHASFLATVTRWAVFIFAIFAALVQLGIAPTLINTLFTGFVAMVAIAGGLAFGLGGKEYAGELIDTLKKSIKK